MDVQGVAIHALSLNPPMVYWADNDLGVRLAGLVNDAMAEATRAHPERFVALATLPMQDPEAAVNEVDRAVKELGCRGIYLGTNVRGNELNDDRKSTRLNSSHLGISYAVFCLKKKR